jgi:hypothetical protein
LEALLSDHPNPLFVASVCLGLQEGFWPWADTLKEGYPTLYDGSRTTPSNITKATFIHKQCNIEIQKGHFSESFGTYLLPGMYCIPVHAVTKLSSTNL